MSACVVGLVTCGSPAEARKIARAILTKKLAACVNILDGMESHYWWQGKLENAKECLLLIKTTRAKTKEVIAAVKAAHSYQVPEIIFLSVATGERKYLNWLRRSAAVLAALSLGAAAARADRFDDLVAQLGSTNDEERAEAAGKLAEIGGPRAEKQFREMIESTNPERRQMAAVGLLQVNDSDENFERVKARLQDENSTVRWSAALALGQSGRTEAIAALQDVAKSDEAESVREAASEAVTKLQSTIPWLRSLPAALKQAKGLHKPVLAYFFVRGSDVCQQYEEGVLADKSVVDAAQEFVPVRIDAARNADEARRFDVRGAPTILILDAEGNEMSRAPGLMDTKTLLGKLAPTRAGKLSFREARRLALKDPSDVQANWKVAETYLEEGREDLAEPHLRNVIDHDEENQHGHTAHAIFALGFGLGKRGQYAQAAYSLEYLLKRWPQFKDKDKALYCLGLSELALGHKDKGRAALEQLIAEFPESSVVKPAQQSLEKLK